MAGYGTVKAALTSASALVETIAPRKIGVKSATGETVKPEYHFEGNRSTAYDAIFIPGGEHVKTLAANGRVIHWIREAFGHCKAIAALGEGKCQNARAMALAQFL